MVKHVIWHEVRIKATPGAVYEALTEPKKMAQWWIPDTRGASVVGQNLEFWFGNFCQPMKVTALESESLVKWQGAENGLPDWVGTEVEFKIFKKKDLTYVRFRHSGWTVETDVPYYSMSWAVFLVSLKELLEKGKGFPFPNEWLRN
jgi:uncharacterized protein YndB with AHSA1/START domain